VSLATGVHVYHNREETDGAIRGEGMRRLSRFEEEDDVRYLPLGEEVVEEKDCIEEVGEKFDADRG
jgi:hypothetical protein